MLQLRAKFTPYALLRQVFWMHVLRQSDTQRAGGVTMQGMCALLASMGSTLSPHTVQAWFTEHGNGTPTDILPYGAAILVLEREIQRPWTQKRPVIDPLGVEPLGVDPTDVDPVGPAGLELDHPGLDGSSSTASTDDPPTFVPTAPPAPWSAAGCGPWSSKPQSQLASHLVTAPPELAHPKPSSPRPRSWHNSLGLGLGRLSASPWPPPHSHSQSFGQNDSLREDLPPRSSFALAGTPATSQHLSVPSTGTARGVSPIPEDPDCVTPEQLEMDGDEAEEGTPRGMVKEQVIRLSRCPLCGRRRLARKGEVDIVTHLAVCASHDWAALDKLVTKEFVTAHQAQRKWYFKMVRKLGQGSYALGANSANIIVQDRETGEMIEEAAKAYVFIGIRALYKGARAHVEGARVRKMLRSMTLKSGAKFDDPASKRDIVPFVTFHKLNLDEYLLPLSEYQTFNQFFYRKLKPGARPIDEPGNERRLVSAADCRLTVFASVQEATRIWIKGLGFSLRTLLAGAADGAAVDRVEGGPMCIFRLAPQDYHRFHLPVSGRVVRITDVPGEYFTVNPQAVRSRLDIFGLNRRAVVVLDTPAFGRMYLVAIGATMVGSIIFTVTEGQAVRRGDELGYFAFGGSTLVCLFEPGRAIFDEDLITNSRAAIESLVRVGNGIGRANDRRISAPMFASAPAIPPTTLPPPPLPLSPSSPPPPPAPPLFAPAHNLHSAAAAAAATPPRGPSRAGTPSPHVVTSLHAGAGTGTGAGTGAGTGSSTSTSDSNSSRRTESRTLTL